MPVGGMATKNSPRWRDLVTTDGEFDVYRFQMLIFSIVVGGALLRTGLTDLASFKIPETLLGVLGLSQVVYVGGKLAGPPTCGELDKAVGELRALETSFIEAAATDPAQPGAPAAPAADVNSAKSRAPALYLKYKKKAEIVGIMFQAVMGMPVATVKLEPEFA